MPRASRVAPLAFAAIALLGACGSDGDGASEQPLPTAPDTPPTTTPDQEPVPTGAPTTSSPVPATSSPVAQSDQRYEVIASVIEGADGPRLCFTVLESQPPQCGSGLALNNWSWDDIDVEQSQNGVTWVDSILVTGTYDDTAQTFDVDGAGIPSDEDRERLMLSRPLPDFSVPCAAPAGGWPARTEEVPTTEHIAALDGYAGSWIDESQQVLTVKFTGDLAAAESAVRQRYTDPVCVVAAEHSQAELSAIQQQLLGMSSVELLSTWIYVDATAEWIGVLTMVPNPDLQTAVDTEFGPGVVRLQSTMQPVD